MDDKPKSHIPTKAEYNDIHPHAGTGWQSTTRQWEQLKPFVRQMRKKPTPAEAKLWQHLRHSQLGVKIRRQHAIDRYVVDFYCKQAHLIIEVDGPIHLQTQEHDEVRQEWLENRGYEVLRFTNSEVMEDIVSVIATINSAIKQRL